MNSIHENLKRVYFDPNYLKYNIHYLVRLIQVGDLSKPLEALQGDPLYKVTSLKFPSDSRIMPTPLTDVIGSNTAKLQKR